MAGGISARVISNRLPTIARSLGIQTDHVLAEGAEMTRRLWANDVRVSDGAGGYDGRAGGEAGHYRDNIYVRRGERLNSFIVAAYPWYSVFNEFGSVTISPKPSAEQAANQGFEWLEAELGKMITAALS